MRTAATTAQLRARLPAYGSELLALRLRVLVPARGWCNAHVLIVLDDWRIASQRWRLVVTRDSNPSALDFICVAGLDVVLVYDSRRTDGDRLHETARAILRGLPASLATFDACQPNQTCIIKSRAAGIELADFRDA